MPSGKAVRLHEDKLNEINEAIDAVNKKGANKRKRKQSFMDDNFSVATKSSPAFEILSKPALMSMMPPPPPMGLLGQHLCAPRGLGSRGGRRGGGRRSKHSTPRMMTSMQPPPQIPPTASSISQQNLAMLAQAINHQKEQEATAVASSPVPATTTSEPPQVAITPPKVVVVTTPSGTYYDLFQCVLEILGDGESQLFAQRLCCAGP